MPLDDVGGLEMVEHCGDRGGVEIGALGELPGGHLALAPERGQGADLGVGELAGPAVVPAAQAPLGAEHLIRAPGAAPRPWPELGGRVGGWRRGLGLAAAPSARARGGAWTGSCRLRPAGAAARGSRSRRPALLGGARRSIRISRMVGASARQGHAHHPPVGVPEARGQRGLGVGARRRGPGARPR